MEVAGVRSETVVLTKPGAGAVREPFHGCSAQQPKGRRQDDRIARIEVLFELKYCETRAYKVRASALNCAVLACVLWIRRSCRRVEV